MAYNIKYYYTFKSLGVNDTYTVQLLHTGTTENTLITGDVNPFSVQYIELKNKLEPVKSSGCDLNLLSVTDRQFIGLFSPDMFRYQIRLLKNGTLNWCGYLDSEMYKEDFSKLNNYTVRLTGNDGFALLDRLTFMQSNGTKYSGYMSIWEYLVMIFQKLELPYNYIYVGLSTTSPEFTIAGAETLLHKVKIQCQNFYNEDNEPETLRTVLEGILKPFGAMITQVNGSIYIYDLNTILASPASFKKYNASTYAYISTDSITTFLGDISTIDLFESGMNYDIVSAINKQKLTFSTYTKSSVIDYEANDKDIYHLGTLQQFTNADTDYGWQELFHPYSKTLNGYKTHGITGDGQFVKMYGRGSMNNQNSDQYLKLDVSRVGYDANYAKLFDFKVKPFINYKPDTTTYKKPTYFLKVSMQAYFQTKIYEDKPDEVGYEDLCYAILRLKVTADNDGQDWQYSNILNGWAIPSTPTSTTTLALIYQADIKHEGSINDQWISNNNLNPYVKGELVDYQLIPLNSEFGGTINFEILSAFSATNKSWVNCNSALYAIRIKNIKVELADKYGNTISQPDIEYSGVINEQYKNAGDDIKLLAGTNYSDNPFMYGSMLDTSNNNIKTFTRAGNTAKIEELLLNTVQSNYENPIVKLSANLNMLSSGIGYVTYSNYLSGKKFILNGYKVDYDDNANSVTLIEAYADNMTLNIT